MTLVLQQNLFNDQLTQDKGSAVDAGAHEGLEELEAQIHDVGVGEGTDHAHYRRGHGSEHQSRATTVPDECQG